MQVIVNGAPYDAKGLKTLFTLIEALKLNPFTLVAEVNGRIVPQEEFESYELKDGDTFELVKLVGGG